MDMIGHSIQGMNNAVECSDFCTKDTINRFLYYLSNKRQWILSRPNKMIEQAIVRHCYIYCLSACMLSSTTAIFRWLDVVQPAGFSHGHKLMLIQFPPLRVMRL